MESLCLRLGMGTSLDKANQLQTLTVSGAGKELDDAASARGLDGADADVSSGASASSPT